jgi:hypothetical protein
MLLLIVANSGATGVVTLPANPVGSLFSNGGAPPDTGNIDGGFYPKNYNLSLANSYGSWGTEIKCAGGNLGNMGGGIGTNCLIAYDDQNQTGSAFMVWNNSQVNQPHRIFSVERSGYTRAQGLDIAQWDPGPPYYNKPQFWYSPTYPTPTGTPGALNVTTDMPNAYAPVVGIWGIAQNRYGTSILPPLISLWGNNNISSSGYLVGSTDGANVTANKVLEVADNGHMKVGGTASGSPISVSSCGTSPTIAGKDNAFVVTLGTGTPSACTVTFGWAWDSTDFTCAFISETDLVNWKMAKVGSANAWTGVTFTASAALTNASKIHGTCIGHV